MNKPIPPEPPAIVTLTIAFGLLVSKVDDWRNARGGNKFSFGKGNSSSIILAFRT
jgi:hypothetical protein